MTDLYYIAVTFKASEEQSAIITALLMSKGFEGAEDTGEETIVCIAGSKYSEADVEEIFNLFSISYTTKKILQQNWNAQWESSFEPVQVSDFVSVRAVFHESNKSVQHEIIITPKMSFGTGHHATTFLMMEEMQHLDFIDKKVIDFGTGTGVLAILAEKLGASAIVAIDNDDWSIANAMENIGANGCAKVNIVKDELLFSKEKADIILANINLNIILNNMASLHDHLVKTGDLLLSGLLSTDKETITNALISHGFTIKKISVKNNWIVVLAGL